LEAVSAAAAAAADNAKANSKGCGNGDIQIYKQPTVPPANSNKNKKNKSKNNSNNKSTQSVGVTVTENISGGEKQKRLPQMPGESSSPTSRTASTVTETETSNEDDDDVNDVVSLWEDEERKLVEIQLPVCVSSLTFPSAATAITSSSSSTNDRILTLRQYGSADDRWGIHSTIWDGGLALTAYLASHYYSYHTDTETDGTGTTPIKNNTSNSNNSQRGGGVTLIDLGSGTGLVGLAVAALSRGQAAVAVTDLAQALPLLEENVRLNSKLWTTTSNSAAVNTNSTTATADTSRPVVHIPVVHELTWGEPIADAWLEQLLSAMPHTAAPATSTPTTTTTTTTAQSHSHSRILLTGADIIYRPSLFQPLLATLSELSARLHQLAPDAMVECLLACQSRFTYLQDFWDAARRQNFAVDILAVVRLDSVHKTDLSQAKIEYVGGNSSVSSNHLGSKKMTVAPLPNNTHEDDRVYIVRIHKLPYTFSI
jgi:predicted nicotinamide N-methyase